MSGDTPIFALFLASSTALVGLTFGLVYFHVLLRSIDLLTAERGGLRLKRAGLTLVRIAGAVLVLTLIAWLGATQLLAGIFGFLLARSIALRWVERAF